MPCAAACVAMRPSRRSTRFGTATGSKAGPFRVPGDPVPRVAPDTRPGKMRQSAFALVRAVQGNSLRSRERRFESCRGHCSEA